MTYQSCLSPSFNSLVFPLKVQGTGGEGWILTDMLQTTWKPKWYVMSTLIDSVMSLVHRHASVLLLVVGWNIDMPLYCYWWWGGT